jgi:hypothetical protein
MSPRRLLVIAALAAVVRVDAAPPDPATRSVSRFRQFVIYCPDASLRRQVASLVEEVKSDVLELLGEADGRWKIPIVLSLVPSSGDSRPPVVFQMIATPEGPKIEIDVEIGTDLAAVNLRKQIVRAVLLEIAYRDRPPVRGGEEYCEAPWWLVDGAIEILRRRDLGVDSDLFRRLVQNNKMPPIEQFLGLCAGGLGATAEAIDSACAMGLVQLLIEQPNGRANLSRLVRHWPESGRDPMAALAKDFPGLADGSASLQKWWTLNLARFAATNRYLGLSLDETDKQIAALLEFELVIDKTGAKKRFAVGDYAQFIKLPGARAAMAARKKSMIALSAQANALLRPVIAEYDEIFSILSRGKTSRLADRLEGIEGYRATVLHRMDQIADYLNWYEATQFGTRTNAFDSYLKAANELSRSDALRSAPIARYLDLIEKEY